MLTEVTLKQYPINTFDKFVSYYYDLDMTQFGEFGMDCMLEDHPIFKQLCLC